MSRCHVEPGTHGVLHSVIHLVDAEKSLGEYCFVPDHIGVENDTRRRGRLDKQRNTGFVVQDRTLLGDFFAISRLNLKQRMLAADAFNFCREYNRLAGHVE